MVENMRRLSYVLLLPPFPTGTTRTSWFFPPPMSILICFFSTLSKCLLLEIFSTIQHCLLDRCSFRFSFLCHLGQSTHQPCYWDVNPGATCKRQYILELCLVFCCKRTYRYLNLVWPVKDKSDKKWEKTSDDRVGFSPLLAFLVITLLNNVHALTFLYITLPYRFSCWCYV